MEGILSSTRLRKAASWIWLHWLKELRHAGGLITDDESDESRCTPSIPVDVDGKTEEWLHYSKRNP